MCFYYIKTCRFTIVAVESDLVLAFKSAWYEVVGVNTEWY